MFGFWIAAFGLLLPLAVALDTAIKNEAKAGLPRFLRAAAHTPGPAVGLNRLLDRLAGKKLVSWRAFKFSLALSVLSVALMLFAVYLIDGSPAFELYRHVLWSSSPAGFLILVSMFLIVFIGDFVSLAQTRLFIRAANQFTDKYVTAVMLIGDVLSSLFIFVVFMALARLVAYVIVATVALSGPLQLEYQMSPATVVRTMEAAGVPITSIPASNRSPEVQLVRAYALPTTDLTLRQIAYFEREEDVPSNLFRNAVIYTAKQDCVEFDPKTAFTNIQAYTVLANSVSEARSAAEKAPKAKSLNLKFDALQRAAVGALLSTYHGGGKCNIPVIKNIKSVHVARLMADLHPLDLYLASFSMTLDDTTSSIPRKFAEYRRVDPAADLTLFLANALVSSANKFLSVGGSDEGKLQLIGLFNQFTSGYYDPPIKAEAPFTTLAASSMMPSIIFATFLVLRLFARVWSYSASKLSTNLGILKGDDYLLTFLAAVVIILVLSVFVALKLLAISWTALLSLAA